MKNKSNLLFILLICLFLSSCLVKPERNCVDFKNGTFEFTYEKDGKPVVSKFVRNESIEIDYYENKIDTILIDWINDCEYIARNKNPRTLSEKKAIHFKILSTSENSYTFESSLTIKNNKEDFKTFRGTAYKIN